MKTLKLSTIIAFVSILALMTACNETPAETEVETVVETVEVAVEEVPESSTSVTIDANGLEVETEKVDVKVGQ